MDTLSSPDVCCDKHGKVCLIKTGMKEGASYLKSFYVCSQQGPDACGFVQEAKNISAIKCAVHTTEYVDLQTTHYSQSRNEKRIYFRCPVGRNTNKTWCGHTSTKIAETAAASSKDVIALERERQKERRHDGDKENKCLTSIISQKSVINSTDCRDLIVPTMKPAESKSTNLIESTRLQESKSRDTTQSSRPQESKNGDVTQSTRPRESSKEDFTSVPTSIAVDKRSVPLAMEKAYSAFPQKEFNMKSVVRDSELMHRVGVDTVSPAGTMTGSKEANSTDLKAENRTSFKPPAERLSSNLGSDSHNAQQNDASRKTGTAAAAGGRVSQLIVADKKEASNMSWNSSYRDKSVMIVSDDDDSDDDHGRGDSESVDYCDTATSYDKDFSQFTQQSSSSVVGRNAEERMRVGSVSGPSTETGSYTIASKPSTDRSTDNPGGSVRSASQSTDIGHRGGRVGDVNLGGRAGDVNLPQALAQRDQLRKELNSQKMLLKSLDLTKVHDGGARIRRRIADLTNDMEELSLKINSGSDQETIRHFASVGQHSGSVAIGQSRAVGGASSVQSTNRVPSLHQTKMIDYTQANLPNHLLQQMLAAESRNALYGGRMTANRLHEVGQVTAEAIERLHKQLDSCPSAEEEASDPLGLNIPLMTHQCQALRWMTWREAQHPPGGILADDMGLGKTLTVIALILAHATTDTASAGNTAASSGSSWLGKELKNVIRSEATLVVCPASLVHQWSKEIERRVKPGNLQILLYHGENRDRSAHRMAAADIVLTTYNIVSREVGVPDNIKKDRNAQDMPAKDDDGDDDASFPSSSASSQMQAPLLRIAWKRIVIDEAHAIKNHKSLTAMSVCRLRALYRWALTGTPIHNDLLDMYALLRFLRCSPFDEYKLWKRQVDNKSEKGTQRLNTLVKSLLLRRTKDQISVQTGKPLVDLPKKTIKVHELLLSADERKIYDKIFSRSKATMQEYLKRHEQRAWDKGGGGGGGGGAYSSTQHAVNNPWNKDDQRALPTAPGGYISRLGGSGANVTEGGGGGGMAKSTAPGGGHILLLLLRLRQCCGHLHLMKDSLDVEELQSDGLDLALAEQMNELALGETVTGLEGEKDLSNAFDIATPSTKVRALMEGLNEIRNSSSCKKRAKSVVVSQWTKMLDVIEFHLSAAGYRCCTIRGNVPPKKRSEMVDTFNSDPSGAEVMLVSLKAGGVGLNLIGGNHLFMIDMHWNPALESQACDRIYRVGQKNDVFIHRFICKDTVEEKIVQLQKQKLTLAKNILTGSSVTESKLSLSDLRLLFGIGPDPSHVVDNNAVSQPAGFIAASQVYRKYP